MELPAYLYERGEQTIVVAVHGLNLATQFAHHVVVVQGGTVVRQGPPIEVFTTELLERVSHIRADVVESPRLSRPVIIPYELLNDQARR